MHELNSRSPDANVTEKKIMSMNKLYEVIFQRYLQYYQNEREKLAHDTDDYFTDDGVGNLVDNPEEADVNVEVPSAF